MSPARDALVIGGGLAGAALAARLAEAGRSILLLEREAGPHDKVCGEFLSYEAALYLHDLEVDLPAMGAAPIRSVRLAAGRTVATASLPFPASSLSRRVLDEALLRRAEAAGASVRRGAGVSALVRDGGAWLARMDGGETVRAGEVFLATGKHDLRGWKRPPGPQPDLVGFKLHWSLAPEQAADLESFVELILFPGGYAGLEPVEGGRANLCVLVRRAKLAALGRNWDGLLAAMRSACPLLDRRLTGAQPCTARPLAISGLPYGYVRTGGDGPWRLGDQAVVIPSFAGDGMSIALHSARLAAERYLAGGTADDYQRTLAHDVAGQVRRATLLSQVSVQPWGQAVLAGAVRFLPGLMREVARSTRIPHARLRVRGGPSS